MDTTIDPNNIPHISEASVSVEIETEDMTLNIGPQHPSTHGVLRLVAKVDGEKISSVEPVLGYMHRGYEKLAEVRTYPQITTLVNRIDWVSGFANEIPFIAATEKLMEIEVPERAQHIRLILTEMARIASHFVFNGAYALEIGALTPIFLAMEDRERVLDLQGEDFILTSIELEGLNQQQEQDQQQKKISKTYLQVFMKKQE